MSTEQVPTYNGEYCTSRCGNDIDCYHGDRFDEENGIVRNHLDFDVKHDKTEYQFETELV